MAGGDETPPSLPSLVSSTTSEAVARPFESDDSESSGHDGHNVHLAVAYLVELGRVIQEARDGSRPRDAHDAEQAEAGRLMMTRTIFRAWRLRCEASPGMHGKNT